MPPDESLSETIARIDPRFRPVWQNKPPEYQQSLARYFLPHKSSKPIIGPTRPRVIKWYCPFAHQKQFPSGHRYCINVYTGCSHGCEYCYAASYEPAVPAVKQGFARMLAADLLDLEACDVPPAPIHLSNSTDPFQPLEAQTGHTHLALESLLARRHRFTTVVILTKNPRLIVDLNCVDLLRQLGRLPADHPQHSEFEAANRPAVLVEVSLAFWREEARRLYDPLAPSVEDRIKALSHLRESGTPIVIRIDPLFPREPLGPHPKSYSDYGLVEPQTLDDLEQLVLLARRLGVQHVVYSPAKIVQPRLRPLSPVMQSLRTLYHDLSAPRRPVFRGGSWRLPPDLQSDVTDPLKDLCRQHGIPAKCCMQNLIETP